MSLFLPDRAADTICVWALNLVTVSTASLPEVLKLHIKQTQTQLGASFMLTNIGIGVIIIKLWLMV